jgi:tRNA threonylcarbamoyladenosine biosynthesis protein TsaB
MGLILNIDTAIDTANVSIAKDGIILQEAVNKEQKDHAAFLQPAIQSISKKVGIGFHELDAVAVVSGPGSYTGLRVGMASAKGLCFALGKPLITIETLQLLAFQAINQVNISHDDEPTLFCPMVDARRMEVFTALYDKGLNAVLSPCAMIINELFFANQLLKDKIIFLGNGAAKWQQICTHENARFILPQNNALYMSELSFKKFQCHDFADTIYSEPMYVKEFYSTPT